MAAAPISGPNLQPIYSFYPGYIIGSGTVTEKKDGIENEVKVLAIGILKPNIWASLNNKEEILDGKKMVYIKMLPKEIVAIGIHELIVPNFKKFNLTRILLEQKLLAQDTKVMPLEESTYQKVMDTFLPSLANPSPLQANPNRSVVVKSSDLFNTPNIRAKALDLFNNPNTRRIPGLIVNVKSMDIEEKGIKIKVKALDVAIITNALWGQLDEHSRKMIIDGKKFIYHKVTVIQGNNVLTGLGLHFSKYDLIKNLGYRILFNDNLYGDGYPITAMDENEYAMAVSELSPSIPAPVLKSKSKTFIGCLSPGHIEINGKKNGNEFKEICLRVVALSRQLWSQLDKVKKEELMNEKKIVWVTFTQDLKANITKFSSKFVQKIDMHEIGIEQIKEKKARSNILINSPVNFVIVDEFSNDNDNFDSLINANTMCPENTSLVPIQDKIYDKRLKTSISLLSTLRDDHDLPPGVTPKEAAESLIFMSPSDLEEEKED